MNTLNPKLVRRFTHVFFVISSFFLATFVAKAQQYTANFATAPTFYDGNFWNTNTHVLVPLNGVDYEISISQVSPWRYLSTGGHSNSGCINTTGAGDASVLIKRKDNAKFAFYGVWAKYTNYSTYAVKDLTVSFPGSSAANEIYAANSTVTLAKSMNVTSVLLYFHGLDQVYLDNLIVGAAIPEAPALSTSSINNFRNNAALLGGNVTADGGATVTERGIVYNTTGTPTQADNKVTMGSGTGVFSNWTSGLNPNTTYYVRAYATNSIGTTYSGTTGNTFTTAGNFVLAGNHSFNTTWASTSSQPTPFTKYVEGWDVTASGTGTGNVSISRITGTGTSTLSAFEGTASLRGQSATAGEQLNYLSVKANDGSAFLLKSFYTRYGTRSTGTSFGTITVQGYKNGNAVSGATLSKTGVAENTTANNAFTLFDVSLISSFKNIDEFRITASNPINSALLFSIDLDQLVIETAITTAPLTASISSQTNISCNQGSNGSATVTVSGGTSPYTYSWSPSGGTSATATGLQAGSYTVTVTDANALTTSATAVITQPSAITSSASQTNVSCNGGSNGSASVSVSGGAGAYAYSWSPSGSTNATATGLAAGNHSVIITDANGCTATRLFTITQPSTITTSTSQTNVSCNGGSNGSASVSVSGGAGAYAYSWSPSGGTNATATGLTAGNYTVTITDANGCTATRLFTITQPSAITSSASQTNVSCNGGSNGSASISVSGGASGYTYSWSPSGGTDATATGLAAGNYTVTITDANGCTVTRLFTITQPSAITSSASQTNVSCNGGSNGSASVIVSGGAGAYAYSWSPSGSTNATATGLTAGNYTVTITDANGCTVTRLFTITQPSLFTVANSTGADTLCAGSTAVISNSTVGGTWQSSNPTIATVNANGVISAVAAGSTNITYTATNANNCTASTTKSITVLGMPSIPSYTVSTSNVWAGQSGVSFSVAQDNNATSYQWSYTGTGATINNNGSKNITVDFASNATSGMLKAYAVNGCGNSNTSEMSVTVASSLPVTLTKFAAGQKGNDVATTWNVTEELNLSHYDIERSINSSSFHKIGQVAARGNSTATYTFTDLKPATETYNYRLKMIDKDGVYKYSNAVQVKMTSSNPQVKVLNNPITNHQLQLKVADVASGKYELNLISAKGQVIIKQTVQYAGSPLMISVKLPFVAAGTYYLQLHNGTIMYNETVLIK